MSQRFLFEAHWNSEKKKHDTKVFLSSAFSTTGECDDFDDAVRECAIVPSRLVGSRWLEDGPIELIHIRLVENPDFVPTSTQGQKP